MAGEQELPLPPDENVVAMLERWEAERLAAEAFEAKRSKTERRAW